MPAESPTTVSWPDLLRRADVVESAYMGSPVGLMAFHGGLEAGTAEIARSAAEATGASLYVVEQPAELRWHVPSSNVDPRHSEALADWLSHVEVAVSLHGFGRMSLRRRILVGGQNRELAGLVARHLSRCLSGFEPVTDLEAIPVELRGLHGRNPINRVRSKGVQLELPPSARGPTPLPPDPGWGPGGAPARVVEALVCTVTDYQRALLPRRTP